MSIYSLFRASLPVLLPAVMLSALLSLGGCAGASPIEESQRYTGLGQHFRAFQILDAERRAALAAGGSVDSELERAWGVARREFLLDRARRYIFLEFEQEALIDLAALESIAPEHPGIAELRERATHKLAMRAVENGNAYLGKQLLTEAMAEFLEAERVLPGLPEAQVGQMLVKEQVDRLTGLAQQQFLEAIRKLPEFRYAEVRWHSSNAIVNDPKRDDAEALRLRAQRELAQAAVDRGDADRLAGFYGAALMEYVSAKERDKSMPGIDTKITEMEREIEASKLAEKAQMEMRSQRFHAARAALDEAFAKSVMLRGTISELQIENRRLEGERDYLTARDLEMQGRKREALEAFVLLSAGWPDGLKDERERIEGLQSDIDSARKEWDLAVAAEAAGELAKALEHYKASSRFYERMADAKARIARLEQALAAQQRASGSKPGSDGN